MNYEAFSTSISNDAPPPALGDALEALWWDAKGDWPMAHDCAQRHDDVPGMRVHAYLHRKEGDIGNAGYWYRRAGVTPVSGSLDEEWRELVRAFTA